MNHPITSKLSYYIIHLEENELNNSKAYFEELYQDTESLSIDFFQGSATIYEDESLLVIE